MESTHYMTKILEELEAELADLEVSKNMGRAKEIIDQLQEATDHENFTPSFKSCLQSRLFASSNKK